MLGFGMLSKKIKNVKKLFSQVDDLEFIKISGISLFEDPTGTIAKPTDFDISFKFNDTAQIDGRMDLNNKFKFSANMHGHPETIEFSKRLFSTHDDLYKIVYDCCSSELLHLLTSEDKQNFLNEEYGHGSTIEIVIKKELDELHYDITFFSQKASERVVSFLDELSENNINNFFYDNDLEYTNDYLANALNLVDISKLKDEIIIDQRSCYAPSYQLFPYNFDEDSYYLSILKDKEDLNEFKSKLEEFDSYMYGEFDEKIKNIYNEKLKCNSPKDNQGYFNALNSHILKIKTDEAKITGIDINTEILTSYTIEHSFTCIEKVFGNMSYSLENEFNQIVYDHRNERYETDHSIEDIYQSAVREFSLNHFTELRTKLIEFNLTGDDLKFIDNFLLNNHDSDVESKNSHKLMKACIIAYAPLLDHQLKKLLNDAQDYSQILGLNLNTNIVNLNEKYLKARLNPFEIISLNHEIIANDKTTKVSDELSKTYSYLCKNYVNSVKHIIKNIDLVSEKEQSSVLSSIEKILNDYNKEYSSKLIDHSLSLVNKQKEEMMNRLEASFIKDKVSEIDLNELDNHFM